MSINPSFWRSSGKTDDSFLTIVNKAFHTNLPTALSAKTWLDSMGYYTNFNYIIPPILPFLISAGSQKSFYDNNGAVWGWGYNTFGQLGDNTTTSRLTPVSILGTNKTFCKIFAGSNNAGGIDKNGQVWCWGYNDRGQLGDNTVIDKYSPVSILGAKKTFCNISTGGSHTIGIDKNGQIWGWGYNNKGEIGNNSRLFRCTPVSILGAKKTFCNISVGVSYTTGLDKNGQVWGWGNNYSGQLGDNSLTSKCTPVSILGTKKTFCNIAAGISHTIGIDKNGLVWGWGYNNHGQLGDNSTINRCTPVSILGTKKTFCKITGGDIHTMGIDKNGLVWGWGSDQYGQLGNKVYLIQGGDDKRTPVSILGNKKTFCNIAAGQNFTIGIDNNRYIWSWGYNQYGQLGLLGITALSCFCTPVSILGVKKTFCNISSGSYHTIGIDKNGLVWGWGNNQYGQIGNNSDQTNIYTPISIQGIKKTFCKIMSGQNYTIVIDKNGLVWGWGSNGASQLGDNTGINRCTPVSILGAKKTFCNISAHNGNNVMGIDNKGQVWGWGYNNNGKLGINSIINKCTPVSILGAKKTFCIIAAGNNHTMGINNRGQVWGWGYNNNGQLGINSIIDKCTPVSILGVKKTFCKITAGNNYTLGIDKNGLVWCWGNNNYGQLGDNSLSVRCTPVSILGVKKTFCEISAGYNNTGGIDKNGQVWGWGYNYYGQLGDNSNVSRLTPVSILGTKKTFCKIYFSISTTIAMDYKYQIWGWGNNNSLTLTAIDTTTPIRVYNF